MSMTAEQLGTPSAVTLARSDATRVRHALESLGLETPMVPSTLSRDEKSLRHRKQ